MRARGFVVGAAIFAIACGKANAPTTLNAPPPLPPLLGETDTPSRAAYALVARQWEVPCDAPVAQTASGIEVTYTVIGCDTTAERDTLLVAADANVSVASTTTVPNDTTKCISAAVTAL